MSRSDEREYESILRSYDDPVYVEYPLDADYDEDLERFRSFARSIVERIPLRFKVEDGALIQDATFLGEIRFSLPEGDRDGRYFLVRVSNWGSLAGVWNESVVEPRFLEVIRHELESHGYTYVPQDVLSADYDGQNEVFAGMQWWDRFFEWY